MNNSSNEKSVLIFSPNSLEKQRIGYLKGFYKDDIECEAFYITDDKISSNFSQCIGYVGKNFKNCKLKTDRKYLFLNSSSGKISINNCIGKNYSVVEVVYDYKDFKNSNFCGEVDVYGKHFKILSDELKKCRLDEHENGRRSFKKCLILILVYVLGLIHKIFTVLKPAMRHSATFLHFEDSIINIKWFLTKTAEEHKVPLKVGNALVAKIVDILIGIILLHLFLKYESDIIKIIHIIVEDTITSLKNLLLYLMGSPIGLKLNYSFNKSLGKFFFYHISLWRIFLLGMEPLLKSYLGLLVLPGALGFSFQVAMFSDIISIATFHVYCIYVYAARLFSLQVRGLISLWRLFIGRKYNPLRKRVDSCQYSQNQLFIGTLGFTVLLFLLPTTTMYYAVFTTFRLAILMVDGILLRIRYLLNMLPLYIITLWAFNSSNLAGTIYIHWKNSEEADRILIEAKLNSLSLNKSIKNSIPDTLQPITGHSFGYIFHCMFTGVLI